MFILISFLGAAAEFEALCEYVGKHGRVRRILQFTQNIAAEMSPLEIEAMRQAFPSASVTPDEAGELEG